MTHTFREILEDTRTYRAAIRAAFATPAEYKQDAWEFAHSIANRLIQKYGTVTYARMDNIAYRYS